jgi:hypothetical protein
LRSTRCQTHQERRDGGCASFNIVCGIAGQVEDRVYVDIIFYAQRDAQLINPSIERDHLLPPDLYFLYFQTGSISGVRSSE